MARQPDVQYIRFYTDGSAARKVATVVPFKTIKLPKLRKHKRKSVTLQIDPIAIAGIVMSVVMVVLMAVGAVQLSNTRNELQSMTDYVDTLQQENLSLEATYSAGYDLEAVERTALALGMVPKEQVQHITIHIPPVEAEETPGMWDRFYTFLTGLFA